MKVSVSWLLDLCDLPGPAPESDEIARRLTQQGLEIEGIERFGEGLGGVVVAEVLSRAPHPKSDHLTLVEVTDGERKYSVVCGAANVPAPGGRVALARVGARIPGKDGKGMVMEAREVRGARSEGMLCSEDELGIPRAGGAGPGTDDGIVILEAGDTPGALAVDVLAARDVVLDVNVMPNRPDCLSHLGIAREVAAAFHGRLRRPPTLAGLDLPGGTTPAVAPIVPIQIESPDGCPRYVGLVIEGLTIGPAPRRMRRRLALVGVRPISNVVDVTNYVLMELGHPLHAFDLDKLSGPRIVVRTARPGERITTLDGVERSLEPSDLCICDARGPVALAGVMGGRDTEVSAQTRRVLLEAASFEPRGIRRTVKRTGLASESSYRFERGVDPEGVAYASRRAALLLAEHAGGRPPADPVDAYPRPRGPSTVRLRPGRAEAVLGLPVRAEGAARLLRAIEIACEPAPEAGNIDPVPGDDGDALLCQVPTFRPDIEREIDLIEEIARLGGLDDVPATLPAMGIAPRPPTERDQRRAREERLRDVLTSLGLDEAPLYSFTSRARIEAVFGVDVAARAVTLTNPLGEDLGLLRPSLLPNLVAAVRRNQDHGVRDVRLFEIGAVFAASGRSASGLRGRELDAARPHEERRLALVVTGAEDGWLKPGVATDVHDAVGALQAIGRALRVPLSVVPWRDPDVYLHPGSAGRIVVEGAGAGTAGAGAAGKPIGVVGELHPRVRQAVGLEQPAFVVELALDELPASAEVRFHSPPRFPRVERDISFFVDDAVPARELIAHLEAGGQPLLREVRVLDDYREAGKVPAGQKSILLTLAYRADDRTLTDAEVDKAHIALIDRLKQHGRVSVR
jgi:phenylalanyl-tRNA synthetase beta chain